MTNQEKQWREWSKAIAEANPCIEVGGCAEFRDEYFRYKGHGEWLRITKKQYDDYHGNGDTGYYGSPQGVTLDDVGIFTDMDY